jgi:hypothetical protein
MMLQLNPPLPVKTPKGDAWATVLIDYGPQWDLLWVTFIEATGECWSFQNSDIRQDKNYTYGHGAPTPFTHGASSAQPAWKHGMAPVQVLPQPPQMNGNHENNG